jgi:hypothetical protein
MKRKFFTNYSRPHGRFNPCQQICKADQPDCEAPGLKCAEKLWLYKVKQDEIWGQDQARKQLMK